MNNLVYFRGSSGWAFNVIVSWAIENNLVNFWLVCDSFLGYCEITIFGIILLGSMIMIVSWAVFHANQISMCLDPHLN